MIINEQGGVLVVDNVRTVLFGVGGLPSTQDLSGLMVKASNLSDLTSVSTARTNLGLGSLATQSGTFSGTSSGTNTGDQNLSGLLVKASNLSDLTNTTTARTNLGLGSLATQSGTFSGTSSGTNTGDQDLSGLLVKASNLSDLTNTTTARTNLGLGSLATQSGTFSGTSSGTNTGDQDLSGYLTKAGNLSGLVSTTTARTNLGLGTAATRNVGQAAGNVLELSARGQATIGESETYFGKINLIAYNGNVSIENNGSQIVFTDDYGGNVVVPNGVGTLALLSQVGDRYLTSSTSYNTVGNGAKTFTVGTGLAYTPTQDITIVFNASNHMHASVTTYNSATGALVVDVNSHTGSGTYAVWTVNVGGIGAGAIPSGGTAGQVLAKLSSTNYDDAWVTPTVAVGGITGLGTGVATALAVNVGTAGAAVVNGGALGTPVSGTLTSCTGLPIGTGITGFGTGVATALAINVGTAGAPVVNGGALGTPSSGTVTNLTGTASININGTVGATTPTTGAFTTLNASGLTRVGTATTADALSDVLIATSATTQRGLTIQGKASQTAPLLRIVESTNNAANNGWQFDANAVYWTGSGTVGGYLNQALMITQPGFFYKWNSSTTNVFSAATFSLGPTVAGSKILAIGNGTQFDTSGGISCAQIILDKTITAAGTTGAQTINKSSGAVNFAAAATSLVVTNSLVTVNSVIQCTVASNDTTMKSVAIVATAGSFTIYSNAAPTAETRVFFSITN
jgi:hypothetical protein